MVRKVYKGYKMLCEIGIMTIQEQLRAWRKGTVRLTQFELADRLGINRATYKNYESHVEPPGHVAEKLASLGFRPSTDVVGQPANIVTYPTQPMRYAGELPAGDWVDPLESETFEDVEAKHFKANRFCARIVGDSCHPALQRGDFTIWETSKSPRYGLIVVGQNGDHAVTVKRLDWDSQYNRPALRAINPQSAPVDASRWAAIAFLVMVQYTHLGIDATLYDPNGISASALLNLRSANS